MACVSPPLIYLYLISCIATKTFFKSFLIVSAGISPDDVETPPNPLISINTPPKLVNLILS